MRAETNYFHHDKLRGTVEALASRTGSGSELSPKHMRLLMFLLGSVFADGLPGPLWRPRTSFTAFVRRRFVTVGVRWHGEARYMDYAFDSC
jgi:hypothetical protein